MGLVLTLNGSHVISTMFYESVLGTVYKYSVDNKRTKNQMDRCFFVMLVGLIKAEYWKLLISLS